MELAEALCCLYAMTQALDHLSQGILILKDQKIGTEDEPLKCTTYRKYRKQIFIVKCYRKLFTETMELVLNRLFCFVVIHILTYLQLTMCNSDC